MTIDQDTLLLHTTQSVLIANKTAAYIKPRCATYSDADIDRIVWLYAEVCRATGVNLEFALVQMVHETGALTSMWSAPPRRNSG